MSTVTGPDIWSNISADVGSGDGSWTNIANARTNTGTKATITGLLGYPDYEQSDDVYLYNWDSRGSVDTDAIIENIKIRVYNHHTGTTIYNPSLRFSLSSGGLNKSVSMRQTPGWSTFDGDLAYWGVTNAEALAFVHATSANAGFWYTRQSQVAYDHEVYAFELTVTWSERPPAGGVLLGGLS